MNSHWNVSDVDLIQKIGIKLKHFRLEANLSQQSVADKTGMSRSSVSDIENGNNFTLQSFISYLRAINKLDMLTSFFKEEEAPVSPIALYKAQQNKKQRGGYKK